MNGVEGLAKRIMVAANAQMGNTPTPRSNPRPPGVIQPGSATAAVLEFLRQHPRRYFRRDQIVLATGRTERAVDWALLFLRAHEHVKTGKEVPPQNTRYLRYTIAITDQPLAGQVQASPADLQPSGE